MPRTTSQLFTARDYFEDAPIDEIDAPTLRGREHNEDHLGAGFLFVMLSERVDPATAMAAVDGWRGDAYRSAVVTGRDGAKDRICVAALIRTASPEDGTELRDALGTWSESMPADANVEVAGDDEDVSLRSCDPGPDAEMALTGKSLDALVYPVVRNELAAGQIASGMDRDAALCVAETVLPELTPDELAAEEVSDELQERLSTLIFDAMDSC